MYLPQCYVYMGFRQRAKCHSKLQNHLVVKKCNNVLKFWFLFIKSHFIKDIHAKTAYFYLVNFWFFKTVYTFISPAIKKNGVLFFLHLYVIQDLELFNSALKKVSNHKIILRFPITTPLLEKCGGGLWQLRNIITLWKMSIL